LPQRKEPDGSWGLEELEEILAVTNKSRRLGERLKAIMATRLSGKTSIFGSVFVVSKSLLGIERQKKL